MRISTKGRYGLKAMVDLAINSNMGNVTLCSIAKRQQLSETYLEQLFASIKKAGLIKSIRGANGGYILNEEPSKITVGDILRALEGSLSPTECASSDTPPCEDSNSCVTKLVWKKISDSINIAVDTITLSDLIEEYNNINFSDRGVI